MKFDRKNGSGGKPVHLVKEHHHHGDLRNGAVDAYLRHSSFGHEVFDQLPVDELVGRARQSADQQRQRIGEDRGQQRPVDLGHGAVHGGEDDQPRHDAGDQVGDEDPTDAEFRSEKPGDAESDGQRYVHHHVQRLDADEQQRPSLLAQPREGDAGPDVEEDDKPHPDHVFGMCGISLAHQSCDAVAERSDKHEEHHGGERCNAPRRGEKPAFGGPNVAPGLLGLGRKTEVARLHAHRQQRKRQRNEGIDVRDDAIGLLPENTGIVRREQIAQKPHHNGADAVDGGCLANFSSMADDLQSTKILHAGLCADKDTNFSRKPRIMPFLSARQDKNAPEAGQSP